MKRNLPSGPRHDGPTIIAIAVVAWALFAVLHEIIGHAGAAFLLGEKVRGAVTTTVHIADFYDLAHVTDRIGWWGFRAVAAAGTAVNIIAGSLALLMLKSGRIAQPSNRYFLWIFGTISLWQQAFWLAVMPFAGLGGDWTAFFIELDHAAIWKGAVTGAGILLLWTGYRLPLRFWRPALGDLSSERRRQILRLTVIPVMAAFVFQILSVAWSPLKGGRHTTVVSVFSFIPLLLWLIPVNLARWPAAAKTTAAGSLLRSKAWLVIGLAVFILYVFVLGTGIGSFDGHPDYAG